MTYDLEGPKYLLMVNVTEYQIPKGSRESARGDMMTLLEQFSNLGFESSISDFELKLFGLLKMPYFEKNNISRHGEQIAGDEFYKGSK